MVTGDAPTVNPPTTPTELYPGLFAMIWFVPAMLIGSEHPVRLFPWIFVLTEAGHKTMPVAKPKNIYKMSSYRASVSISITVRSVAPALKSIAGRAPRQHDVTGREDPR